MKVQLGFPQSKFSDCVVACEGREFRCHKNILASRSTVFDAMFTHDMEENRKSKVDIVALDGDTVHDMVRYIYSGKVCSSFHPFFLSPLLSVGFSNR